MRNHVRILAMASCLWAQACGSSEKPGADAGGSGGPGAGQASGASGGPGASGSQSAAGTHAGTGSGGNNAGNDSCGNKANGGGAGLPTTSLSPPVDCSKLSSVVGTWQNISPSSLLSPPNMEVYSVAVNPVDGTVFMSGGNNTNGGACPKGTECPQTLLGVMRSSDCGATFSRINSVEAGTDSANLVTGALWAMVLDPKQPDTMYVANGYGMNPTLYKSTNAGVDWKALQPDPDGKLNFVQAVAVSPYDSQHLAVTWHVTCEAPHTPFCFSKSTDGGDTWQLFNGPTSIPDWKIEGWMEASAISILGPTSYLATTPAGIWFTGDTGATWTQLAAETIYATYSGSSVIAGGDLFIAGAGHIWTSPAAAGDPPFALGTSHELTALANSPTVTALVTDGKSLFVGSSREGPHQLWTASLSDTSKWTQTTDEVCHEGVCRGPNEMAYDPVHHVVYAANWASGLWRLVLE